MRLIKIGDLDNLRLSRPMLEADAPPFAILSHTWGDAEEELSFQDMADLSHHKHKKGFEKIRSFCAQAKREGYEYAWADTVCIDQTSSAELSEAINSMYRWYSISAVCFVFLEDLFWDTSSTSRNELHDCRWFTRGWTLQELLAPEDVVFFDRNWDKIGNKEDILGDIIEITGIDVSVLTGNSVKSASIARRMSWASKRHTSRPEDRAYSLLGIFGIYMPPIYGEGERAFIRLQEEILRSSNDHSIFAWTVDQISGASRSGFWGLLAPSPAYFRESSDYLPIRGTERIVEHSVTGRGISLNVLANPSGSLIIINCQLAHSPMLITLPVVRLRSGPNEYARRGYPARPGMVPSAGVKDISKEIPIFVRNNIHEKDFEDQYLVPYTRIICFPSSRSGYTIHDFYPGARYDMDSRTIFASPFSDKFCGAMLCFKHNSDLCPPFIVTIFADGVPEGDDCMSQDVVGVFSGISSQCFFDEFEKWIEGRQRGDVANSMKLLPGAVNMLVRDGVQAWNLNDGTFVQVSVQRGDHRYRVDSTAVAEIRAGTSWERDILGWGDDD